MMNEKVRETLTVKVKLRSPGEVSPELYKAQSLSPHIAIES